MPLGANFQPLYKQVYALLTQRLVDGNWKPEALGVSAKRNSVGE
ncbi:MAG: hypothetical protein ACI9LY_002898 [Arenicella sp.]|jgi:hypothetical protein